MSKSGGLIHIAVIACAAGIGVYGSCMFETSVAHPAGAHSMAALPEASLGCEFYMSTWLGLGVITN